MGAIQVSLESMPSHLGRYRITSRIATSISEAVYRAWDDELRRDVAIRVPSREWLTAPSLVDEYLAKASRLSRIEHPQIVPLYDVGRTDDGHCYLVTKFIAEENLADRIRRAPPTASWSVNVIVQLAEALHFAHKSGIIHGNFTPAHVVFDEENVPCLTGFGLPLFPAARLLGSGRAGEAGYQSPEQLSGELHRIDARADVYSLGAVLYELLAGQWPLAQQPVSQVIRQAMQYEPPLLSDLDPTQPVELARVCQKALSRRIGDRYSTIVDFAADLQQCIPMLPDPAPAVAAENWTAFPPGTVSPTANGTTAESGRYGAADNADSLVVPKGLRSFDQEDSDFFLELLPGPRGRSGLPDTLHFWKSQIEETDPAATFSVGLIYGPSGCGKSSLVKAGLLPRLDDWIIPVYIEATPEATEARLLAQLRRRCPLLPGHLELTEALAELRRGKFLPAGKKVVIFLDQFEQWLHASRDDERPELSAALRQCDGRRLQCIVMVRDDFWMAVTRFMHDIEVKLVEGHNSAAVDLFGVPHARKVLTAFGRAYQCLPRTESDQTPQERAFLDQAIAGLAQDGKVVSVQLALFAEMVKNKPWTPETLAEVGGAEGIGLTFLEETFSGTHSPPEHRRHQRAARAVLRLLLPEQGTDIKGQMHSHERLLTGSGYAERPKEFEELLNILDQELRLVTPADPAGLPENQKSENPILSSHFQLTHDFLVPSVRRWLVRNQQETRRGRAELLLDEKTATWIVRPERRYLPSSWQWFRIRTLTSPRAWSLTQRDMMHSASVYHSVRAVGALAIVAFLTWGSFEALLAVRAQNLQARLLYVHLREVPSVIQDMASNRWWVNRFVRAAAASAVPHSPEDMRARLALLPDDSSQVEYLYEECFAVDDDSLTLIASELAPYREQFVQRLWTTIEDPAVNGERQLRASIMLARIAAPQQGELPGRWAESVSTVARHLHEATLADPSRFQSLVTGLAPVSHLLVDLLSERARDETRTKTDRAVAANILIEYAAGRAVVLTAVLLDSQNTNRQSIIIEKLQPMAAQAVALLEPELAKRSDDLRTTWKDGPLNLRTDVDAQLTKEIEEADGLVADWFSFCQSLPLEDFQRVADGLRSAGYRPTRFRPFLGNDVVLVAALWTRDDRTGKIETGLTESEMRLQVSGPRMKSELLVDLAAYQTPTGEVKHTAVWAERRDTDPEATAYIGPYGDLWYQTLASQNKEGFGIVGQDFRPLVEIGPALSAVFWKGRSPGEREIRSAPRLETELAGEIAGRVVVSIDVTPVAAHSRADARRAEHFNVIRDNEEKTRTHPENLQPWIWGGHRRFLVGQYEQTIRDFTHVIENWSDSSGEPWMLHTCHEYRTYAAARLGHKQEAAQYLEQANAVIGDIGDSPFWQEFRKQAMTLNGGELHNQAEEFEKVTVHGFEIDRA